MTSRLLILAFLVSVAGDALAAVVPHMDGDGGCSAECCQAARQNRRDANLSKLRCIVDCNQPGETSSPSPVARIMAQRHGDASAGFSVLKVEAAPSLHSISYSQNYLPAASADIYLRTGTLLI